MRQMESLEGSFEKRHRNRKFEVKSIQAAYAIHFSNYLTSNIPVIRGKKHIFEHIARKYCPIKHKTLPKFYK